MNDLLLEISATLALFWLISFLFMDVRHPTNLAGRVVQTVFWVCGAGLIVMALIAIWS